MEEESYREKYKALKSKFKAAQVDHLKLSSQLEIAMKAVNCLLREKRFLTEKLNIVTKKADKPVKRAKIEEAQPPEEQNNDL
ncbi:unnamed protein product [Blepharisma stoltei]|uniref:Uncharacterized protein n=1 Tax=Blepharisma stoltei TaxID=1481888 RepID=A0AAU9JV69_9CILI|nr:unnamed protein product [Blepharisma stoltei]